jgi:ADP-ribose pyrophosphatase YjhB (NUDIX family)
MVVSRRVICANCGGKGHVFRECTDPIISCGVICYRVVSGVTQYLVVQRKDSYAFVEFMRGKYDSANKDYISQMFGGMTPEERLLISRNKFDSLWNILWNGFSKAKSRPEYEDAARKFGVLKAGAIGYDIVSLMNESEDSVRAEPEWGFPKGRRNISTEPDTDCAVREMNEETGVEKANIVLDDVAPFEETFMGNNGIWYRHVYCLATLFDPDASLHPCDREIKEARWVDRHELVRLMNDCPTRVEMFGRVCRLVEKVRLSIDASVDLVELVRIELPIVGEVPVQTY